MGDIEKFAELINSLKVIGVFNSKTMYFLTQKLHMNEEEINMLVSKAVKLSPWVLSD